MRKLLKNRKALYFLIVIGLLVFVSGCARITDESGQILKEFIITLDTTFNDIIKNEGWFSALLVWPLAQFINYSAQYIGVVGAIIAVTLFVNLLTLAFTVKSTVSSQKMQVIQPEMLKIQDKYKDRKDQQSQMAMANEMNALYAKYGINPFGTILITFIQFPIIIAMYRAVQRSIVVVEGEIFGSKLINTPMFGLRNGEIVLFVIFVLMAIAQFISMRIPQYLAKRKATKKPRRPDDQPNPAASQNTMMLMMMGMILFLSINWPTAMSLYWMITSLVNIGKTLFIQWRYIDNEKV